MKTVFLGDNGNVDVIYEVVTHVRKIENACGVVDIQAPEIFISDGEHLLSDALFNYKNSKAARGLSVKQVSSQFVNDIKSHLSRMSNNESANDEKVVQYRHDLTEYLQELSIIQGQLVDVPEWQDLLLTFKEKFSRIDAVKHPYAPMLSKFIDAIERADSSQAEKIHKTVDMMVKSYLSLLKTKVISHCDVNNCDDFLLMALSSFLTDDLNIDLNQIEPNGKIIHLRMFDAKKAKAFAKIYGDLSISTG